MGYPKRCRPKNDGLGNIHSQLTDQIGVIKDRRKVLKSPELEVHDRTTDKPIFKPRKGLREKFLKEVEEGRRIVGAFAVGGESLPSPIFIGNSSPTRCITCPGTSVSNFL
jgi:hypothetical protein